MTWLDALATAASLLLFAAGFGKIRRPAPATSALHALGLPANDRFVRVGAAAEMVLAAVAFVSGARPAVAAVGASYVVFAAVVVAGLRSGGRMATCGCFGGGGAVPTASHLSVNAGLAAATLTAAANGSSGVVAAVRTGSGAQALVVYFAVLTGYLAYLLLAALPPLHQFASHGVRETTN